MENHVLSWHLSSSQSWCLGTGNNSISISLLFIHKNLCQWYGGVPSSSFLSVFVKAFDLQIESILPHLSLHTADYSTALHRWKVPQLISMRIIKSCESLCATSSLLMCLNLHSALEIIVLQNSILPLFAFCKIKPPAVLRAIETLET